MFLGCISYSFVQCQRKNNTTPKNVYKQTTHKPYIYIYIYIYIYYLCVSVCDMIQNKFDIAHDLMTYMDKLWSKQKISIWVDIKIEIDWRQNIGKISSQSIHKSLDYQDSRKFETTIIKRL